AQHSSAYRQAPAASAIAITSSSNRRLASRTASAASACTGERVGITETRMSSTAASSAAAFETACAFGSFGSTTTWPARVARIAASTSPVAGLAPTTTAPSPANSWASPSPLATTTAPRAAGSRFGTVSSNLVTEIWRGRPASTPASIAAPTSLTWTCTFQVPSPVPTTTSESPSSASTVRSFATASSSAVSRYCTSYAYSDEPASRALVSAAGRGGGGGAGRS